ncbi:hypothetical protein F2Q70_00029933 [Brassica cretica]|uniref:Uncharacterized protein n=1 Tax=Brassica cretica TaxID=69181 RepID=A0A8S9H074_BRACR|nr:hypothetical protein F2Q70_00029933 [Brassica cretica]KAF2549808.1 hypothetical protein F2Q68_00034404 [Brassica cretica]
MIYPYPYGSGPDLHPKQGGISNSMLSDAVIPSHSANRPAQPSYPNPTTLVRNRPLLSENAALPGFSSNWPNTTEFRKSNGLSNNPSVRPTDGALSGSKTDPILTLFEYMVPLHPLLIRLSIQELPSTHGKSFQLLPALSSIIKFIQYVPTARPVSPQIILTSIFGTRSLQSPPGNASVRSVKAFRRKAITIKR